MCYMSQTASSCGLVQPVMGNLPKERVKPGRAFLSCGVGYAGPFLLKSGLRKKAPLTKAFVCLFVCFSTRAKHLDLVSDLSSGAFLHALNRFFHYRGISVVIYSDNTSNFVGANRQLQELYEFLENDEHWKTMDEALSNLGVQRKFIHERSPHFGGYWEVGIKSIKHLLRRVIWRCLFFLRRVTNYHHTCQGLFEQPSFNSYIFRSKRSNSSYSWSFCDRKLVYGSAWNWWNVDFYKSSN